MSRLPLATRRLLGVFALGAVLALSLPAVELSLEEQVLLLQAFPPLELPLQTPTEFPSRFGTIDYSPLPNSISPRLGYEYAYSDSSFAVGRISLPDDIELLLSFRDDSAASFKDARYELHVYDVRRRRIVATHLFGLELARPSRAAQGPQGSSGSADPSGSNDRLSTQMRSGKLSAELRLTIHERYLSEAGPAEDRVVEFEAEETAIYIWNGSARDFTLR
ncbi:MAG: hypothetical protein LC641_05130 [Spirochaeta sp.]|nr:hypothetical protein [Spirochaeta sp.]